MDINQSKLDEEIMFKNEPICHSGCSVYRKDYQSLKPYNWLRSQAIHIMLTLLQEDYVENTKQTERAKVKIMDPFITSMLVFVDDEETFESLRKHQFLNEKRYQYLLFPVNTEESSDGKGSHWYILVYNAKQKSLFEYDSIGGTSSNKILSKHKYKTTEILKNRIESMFRLFYQEKLQINLGRVNNLPKQDNSFDCGVFTVAYAQEILSILKENPTEKHEKFIIKGFFASKRQEYLQRLKLFILKNKN